MPTVEFPLVYDADARDIDNLDKDTLLQNVYLVKENGVLRVKKRPALRLLRANTVGGGRVVYGLFSYRAQVATLGSTGRSNLYFIEPTVTDYAIMRYDDQENFVSIGTFTSGSAPGVAVFTEGVGSINADVIALSNINNSSRFFGVTTSNITEITDPDRPTDARGLTSFNGYVFSANLTHTSHSDLGNSASWNPLNILPPDRSQVIMWTCGHDRHLAVFGEKSLEFFYNAGNPTGSVLSSRRDIMYDFELDKNRYSVSPNWGQSVTLNAPDDMLGLLGRLGDSQTSVFLLRNMRLQDISTPAIRRILNTENYDNADSRFRSVSFLYTQEKTFLALTIAEGFATGTQRFTLVYDIELGIWSQWTTALGLGFDGAFPVMDAAIHRRATTSSQYIVQMKDGSLYTMDSELFQDSDGITTYDIDVVLRTLPFLGTPSEVDKRKFFNFIKMTSRGQPLSQEITVTALDDDYTTSTVLGTIQPDGIDRLSRLGSSYERAFQLSHSANEAFSVDKFLINYSTGTE